MLFFVLFAAHVTHAKVCDNLEFVVKPDTGFDNQYCISDAGEYDGATISGGAYVALKNKGSFPYNFEAGLQLGAAQGEGETESSFKVTVVIGSDLTNDDTNGICLNPYIALVTPEQKLHGYTLHEAEKTGRMNLFGDKGIFGGKPLCAPEGTIKWCLQDVESNDFQFLPEALGLMGASVCLSLESVIISGQGGAFRLSLGVELLHEAIFRATVKDDCAKENKGVCRFWPQSVDKAVDQIVGFWVKARDKIFDKDHIEFSKTLNLGKMIKNLGARQVSSGRRRLANDDIKDDGALCFGDCSNYERAASTAVPVVMASTLTCVFAAFTL